MNNPDPAFKNSPPSAPLDEDDALILIDDLEEPTSHDNKGGMLASESSTDKLVPSESKKNWVSSTPNPWLILMVDDDPEVHAATVLALRSVHILGQPLQFIHTHSAKEARNFLMQNQGKKPDLIFLDMMMESALAGVELAEWLKKQSTYQKIPILLRSGQSGLAGELDYVRKLGVEGIASKGSLTRDYLISTIENLLNGKTVHLEA